MNVRSMLAGAMAGLMVIGLATLSPGTAQAATPSDPSSAAPVPGAPVALPTDGAVGATKAARPGTTVSKLAHQLSADVTPNAIPVGGYPSEPAANVVPSPAFPGLCFYALSSGPCVNSEVAALNHARAKLGQRAYSLPAGFGDLAPDAQILILTNDDRSLYGLAPVLALNPTLNAVAVAAAKAAANPNVPSTVHGVNGAGVGLSAGGFVSAIQIYYEYMYNDGVGSSFNTYCTAKGQDACWAHRDATLINFGSLRLYMGFGLISNSTHYRYGVATATVYWGGQSTIPAIPALGQVSPASASRSGGTTVTLAGYGFTGSTTVHLGSVAVTPTVLSNTSLRFVAPAGTGVRLVTVSNAGGTSSTSGGTRLSYLTASAAGSYIPVAPARLLDTRSGKGAPRAQVKANTTLNLTVTGHGGVPSSGVSAVMLNVTAVTPSGQGNIAVYPHGHALPLASNLNYQVGQTTANAVLVPVGTGGQVSIRNNSSHAVSVLADVMGYVVAGSTTAAGATVPLSPVRLLDTRTGIGAPKAAVAASHAVSVAVLGHGGVPGSGVSAVIVNVTAVTPKAAGAITAYAHGRALPTASTLNLRIGQSTPNLAVVPVGADGRIALFVGSSKAVNLVVDVAGYIRSGTSNVVGGIVPVAPGRLFDSRSGLGIGPYSPYTTPAASKYKDGWGFVNGDHVAVKVTGRAGVPSGGVSAVVLNITTLTPSAPGNVTAFAYGAGIPSTSVVNFIAHQTVPNLVIVPVGQGGFVDVLPSTSGDTGLVVDVAGYVLAR